MSEPMCKKCKRWPVLHEDVQSCSSCLPALAGEEIERLRKALMPFASYGHALLRLNGGASLMRLEVDGERHELTAAHWSDAVIAALAGVEARADAPASIREAARRRQPLGGPDAQALEGALTMTERERDEARAAQRKAFDDAVRMRESLTRTQIDATRLRRALEKAATEMDRITACGEPLRQGGAIPSDLRDLECGLHEAVTIAGAAVEEARAALEGEHRPLYPELEAQVAELTRERDELATEVDRLRSHGRAFVTEILEEEDGEFSEEHTQRVDAALVFGAGLDENHECLDCEGAGWMWTDGAEHGFDRWLEKCDHTPTPEKAREP